MNKIAAKAFIIKNKKVLLVKRSEIDTQSPSIWEIPGGRINKNENVDEGLIREVYEETNLKITPLLPFSLRHFVRTDGEKIILINYICKYKSGKVKLSSEHTKFKWVDFLELKKTN